jgi:hypothetical protein
MKPILHNFQVKLTKAQLREIQSKWSAHAVTGAVMLIQPRPVGNTVFGPARDDLNIAIVSPELGRAIGAVIEGFRRNA